MKNIPVAGMLILLLYGCKKETPISPLPPDSSIPTLSHPLASFASTLKFIAFGDTLPDFSLNKGYEITLSDTNTSYEAACPGIVTAINPGPGGSYSIEVTYKPNSIYSFVYSGVKNVQVHVSDSLKFNLSGSVVLGKVGNGGTIDFMIIKNGATALCPSDYASPGFGIDAAIGRHNYLNPTDSIYQPCLVQSLPR